MSRSIIELPLGKLIHENYGLWQLNFEKSSGLDKFCSDRGLSSMFLGDHIRILWHLGWLRADLISSDSELDIQGLVPLGDENQVFQYSDERILESKSDGWTGSASRAPAKAGSPNLRFHPFRYYVLLHIQRVLRQDIALLQSLYPKEKYLNLLEMLLDNFKEYSKKPILAERLNYWNQSAELAIALEPCFLPKIIGSTRYSLANGFDEFENRIDEYWEMIVPLFHEIGLEHLEQVRSNICIQAEILDPNKNIHTLLRLSGSGRRIMRLKGSLGGSLILLSMAEIIRRAAERVFEIELREEDELGFGIIPDGVKEELYGAKRILDAPTKVKNRFIRSQGLDPSIKIRWYVEGDTEYYALDGVLGSQGSIEFVNLRGHVVAKSARGVAFRDSLRADQKAERFSFVSIDGDRSDFARAVRKAAEEDQICGAFFISDPDFELQNFTIDELAEVIWKYSNKLSIDELVREQVIGLAENVESVNDLLDLARKFPGLEHLGKGDVWGRELMSYAFENPEDPRQVNGQTKRQIVEAVGLVLQTLGANYSLSREKTRVDPVTGLPIRRDDDA